MFTIFGLNTVEFYEKHILLNHAMHILVFGLKQRYLSSPPHLEFHENRRFLSTRMCIRL